MKNKRRYESRGVPLGAEDAETLLGIWNAIGGEAAAASAGVDVATYSRGVARMPMYAAQHARLTAFARQPR